MWLLLLACAPREGVRIGAEAWAKAAHDPLADHQPADADCPAGWGPEDGVLEVDTGVCHYLAAEARLPARARPGDVLRVDLWHQLLDAPERAEGHAALLVDGEVVWEVTVPIPSFADAHPGEWVVDRPLEEGTMLGFHLHNHGDNSWSLGAVEIGRP